MRRTLTLFTGTKLATAATACALSVVTSLTLVAGGMVVSRVVNSERHPSMAARPAIGDPLGPIVVAGTGLDRGNSGASTSSAAASSAQAGRGPADRSLRTVSLLDDAEPVTGGVHTAVDAGEPTRMDEVTPFDRIESILRGSPYEEETSDENKTEETQPDEPEDLSVVREVTDISPDPADAVDPVTDPAYSATEAGSASPSV